ncbi:hypothetical protein PspLS_05610 [Pyricularia sp. CBS 133598]|nr:hypothetical protein PspLS_05610 [Pyricularia sp. CBS 133598]
MKFTLSLFISLLAAAVTGAVLPDAAAAPNLETRATTLVKCKNNDGFCVPGRNGLCRLGDPRMASGRAVQDDSCF